MGGKTLNGGKEKGAAVVAAEEGGLRRAMYNAGFHEAPD